MGWLRDYALQRPPTSSPSTALSSSQVGPGTELALTGGLKEPSQRKIKMSGHLDPMDESECWAATPSQMDAWYAQYKTIKKGPPLIAKEPTPDQLAAMHTRVVIHGLEPYGDFSILTPNGRRMQKRLKYRSWFPQADGSYIPVEVPGPPDLDTWDACWGIFETILFMVTFPGVPEINDGNPTSILDLIAAETYVEAFRKLSKENPEAWHLCCRAEDRARAEHVPRVYRRLKDKDGIAPTWSAVYIAVAEDDRYWDEHVRRPALQFLARNKKVPQNEEDTIIPSVPQAPPGPGRPPRGGRGRKRPAPDQRVQLRPNEETQNKGKGKSKKGNHPRKDRNGRFITNRNGAELCYKFANGGSDACPSPCQNGRVHACQKCLQPHPNDSPSCRATS